MSGFVVIGLRPGRVEHLAASRVAAQESRLKNCPTVEGHAIRTKKALARIQKAPPRIELSPEYCAPQFAVDWARLAARYGYSHLIVAHKSYDTSSGKFIFEPTEQQP